MRKHKDEPTDFLAEADTGSYQTGASRPPRPNNGIVTALLIAVILLVCSMFLFVKTSPFIYFNF